MFVFWTFKEGEINFLIEDILLFFIFSCALIIVKAKRLCIMVGKYHGDKIDKPMKMIWPKFATEVLQIMTGIGEMALSKKHHL